VPYGSIKAEAQQNGNIKLYSTDEHPVVVDQVEHWPEGQYCLLVHALPGPNINCPTDFDGTRVEAVLDAGALTYDLCCR